MRRGEYVEREELDKAWRDTLLISREDGELNLLVRLERGTRSTNWGR